MLYLTFTAPNQDPQAMDLLKRQLSALVANRNQNPQAVFGDRLRALNTGNSYLVRPFTTESVSGLRQDVMARAYAARFANAADFSFLIVGTFDQAAITPLIEQYIGALPSNGTRVSTDKPLNFVFPSAVERTARGDRARNRRATPSSRSSPTPAARWTKRRLPTARRRCCRSGSATCCAKSSGGTYSVSADYSNMLPSPGYGTSTISFGSSPENAEKLTAAVLAEVKRLATEGPTAEDAAKVREQEKRELETSLKQNGYWLGGLQTLITLERDPALLASSGDRIETITAERLKAAYQKYYPMNRYTIATLLPDPAAVPPKHRRPPRRRPRTEWPQRHRAHRVGAPPALDWQRPRSGRARMGRLGTRDKGPRVRIVTLVSAPSRPMPAASPRCQSSAQAPGSCV